jgi:hypothetical protein
VTADPREYIENNDLYDHIYAFMLLGHFGEPKAHQVIVDLFSLPDDLVDKLFGDLITDNLPLVLLRTCNNSLKSIKSLALDKKADDYCRTSALHAMAFAVIEGIASREEVLSFYGTLFTGEETDDISDFWGILAMYVHDLYPEELMGTIEKAYEDELIMPGIVGPQDFEKALTDGKEKCLERLRYDLERRSLDDIHASMSWWACFNKESRSSGVRDDIKRHSSDDTYLEPLSFHDHKSERKKKKAKKKKRKQTKMSKKKNRR